MSFEVKKSYINHKISPRSQTEDSFVNDQNYKNNDNQNQSPVTDILGEQPSNFLDLSEKIAYLQRQLKIQEESQKSQVIHTETIGMMTKYQLVFIKLETSLNKIDILFKQRQSCRFIKRNNANMNFLFDKLINHKMMSVQNYQSRSKFMFFQLLEKLGNTQKIVKKHQKLDKQFAFSKIQFMYKLGTVQFKFLQDQDKIKKSFLNVITQKDNEILTLSKKFQEINTGLQSQKQKEDDLSQKLKSMDQISQQLENDIMINKRNSNLESRGSTKGIQQRVCHHIYFQARFLESENQEMQENIIGADDSVNSFIRDMSELLDSYEIQSNS